MPVSSARRADAAGVECVGNLPQRRCAGLLDFADERDQVGGPLVGSIYDFGDRLFARLLDVRIAEHGPTCLGGGQCLSGPLANQRPLLLRQRS